MSSAKKLQERPKPPSLKQMLEDVSGIEDDDVVFNLLGKSSPSPSAAMIESFMELSATEEKMNRNDKSTVETVDPAVEKSFKDTLELLKCNTKLEEAPNLLQEQFYNLEELGKDISLSISKLQESTDFTLKKS